MNGEEKNWSQLSGLLCLERFSPNRIAGFVRVSRKTFFNSARIFLNFSPPLLTVGLTPKNLRSNEKNEKKFGSGKTYFWGSGKSVFTQKPVGAGQLARCSGFSKPFQKFAGDFTDSFTDSAHDYFSMKESTLGTGLGWRKANGKGNGRKIHNATRNQSCCR